MQVSMTEKPQKNCTKLALFDAHSEKINDSLSVEAFNGPNGKVAIIRAGSWCINIPKRNIEKVIKALKKAKDLL